MGHHGWQGNPPGTEEGARRRIVEAATACIDRNGLTKVSLSDVAAELGVTRQTVYRYYPSLNEILGAVAQAGVEDFAGRMAQYLSGFGTAQEVAVESVVFAVTSIPEERYLSLLVQASETEFFTAGATSPAAFLLGARILREVPVDWEAAGITSDEELAELAEILMRLFISFLQYPTAPARTTEELRALVRRWLGPALAG
jgi:AcrR family transcriptional regulator